MKGLNLLVTMKDKSGSFGRTPLTAACRGHNDMGTALNYFIYEASKEAQYKGIDIKSVEFIEIQRDQNTVIEELHGAVKSKKTLTLYCRKFQEWEFIDIDPYHHKYKVYFKNIQKAVDNPPLADPPKPRGIHAKRVKSDAANDTNGKNTICPNDTNKPDDKDGRIAFLEKEVANLRFQMAKMRFEMPKLIFQMLNLPFPQSSESASEEALSGVSQSLDSIRLLEITEENIYVSNDTSHTQFSPDPSSQLGETDAPNSSPTTSQGTDNTSMASIHDTIPASDNSNTGTDVQKEVEQPSFPIDGLTTRKRTPSNKRRKTKGEVSLTDTTPIPLPEKPSEDEPWTPLTCIKLADYYRGSTLTKSNRKDSDYQKAINAAVSLVNQQRRTYQEVDDVFRFMLCLDKDGGIYDDWWENKRVDLWHIEKHCAGKLKDIQAKKEEQKQVSSNNIIKIRQSMASNTNKVRVISSYDDEDFIDDTFYPVKPPITSRLMEGAAN